MINKKRGRKKGFNLRNEYRKSWNYLKESRNFIYLAVGLFLIFALIGFFIPAPDAVSEYIKTVIQQLIAETEGMSQSELIMFIFINNARTSLFGVILGVFFGIFPLISTVGNGYFIGFVSSIVVKGEGGIILLKLLPHGIFELPAVFISLGLGFKLGTFVFQKNKWKSIKEYFWNSVRVFLFVVLPLLVIAAIIEGSLIFFTK